MKYRIVDRDLTGNRFGKLVVLGKSVDKNKDAKPGRFYWKCKCDCGNVIDVREDSLLSTSRSARSCGCLRSESLKKHYAEHPKQSKHGHSRERLFNIWYLMIYRCSSEKFMSYKNYGGRGISVCNEWTDTETGYESFKVWAENNGYNDELTIDRIDNNGDYTPENCRWIKMSEQACNKRNNILIEYDNRVQTASEWAREIDMPYKTFMNRIYLGWDIERVFTQPLRCKEPSKTPA